MNHHTFKISEGGLCVKFPWQMVILESEADDQLVNLKQTSSTCFSFHTSKSWL